MSFNDEQMAFVEDHATLLNNPEASFVIDESQHETADLMPGVIGANIDALEGLGMIFKLVDNLAKEEFYADDIYEVQESLRAAALGLRIAISLIEGAIDPVVEHAAESINSAASVMGWTNERADLVQRSLNLFTTKELEEDMPQYLDAAIRRIHREINEANPPAEFWSAWDELLEDGDDNDSE